MGKKGGSKKAASKAKKVPLPPGVPAHQHVIAKTTVNPETKTVTKFCGICNQEI